MPLTGMATQGDEDSKSWVQAFKLKYSLDSTNWISVLHNNVPRVSSFSILCQITYMDFYSYLLAITTLQPFLKLILKNQFKQGI